MTRASTDNRHQGQKMNADGTDQPTDVHEATLVGQPSNLKPIVAISMACGLVGLVPLPWISTMLVGLMRRQMVRLIARRHGVKIEVEALAAVVESGPRTGSLVASALTRVWRGDVARLRRLLPLLLRFRDIVQTLLLGLYFDHFCRELNKSSTIDRSLGERLSQAVEIASRTAIFGAFGGVLRHIVGELTGAALGVPRALWRLVHEAATKGEDSAERVIEQDSAGLFSSATRLVERQLAGAGHAAIDGFYAAFDSAWATSLDR